VGLPATTWSAEDACFCLKPLLGECSPPHPWPLWPLRMPLHRLHLETQAYLLQLCPSRQAIVDQAWWIVYCSRRLENTDRRRTRLARRYAPVEPAVLSEHGCPLSYAFYCAVWT
jgi:hypothetical protein